MFRPYKVILRPSKKTDPRTVYVSLHCGISNAFGIPQCSETYTALGCFLGGTEDDLKRSKHVALTSILFYGI